MDYLISVLLHVGIIAGKTLLSKTYSITGNLYVGKNTLIKPVQPWLQKKKKNNPEHGQRFYRLLCISMNKLFSG